MRHGSQTGRLCRVSRIPLVVGRCATAASTSSPFPSPTYHVLVEGPGLPRCLICCATRRSIHRQGRPAVAPSPATRDPVGPPKFARTRPLGQPHDLPRRHYRRIPPRALAGGLRKLVHDLSAGHLANAIPIPRFRWPTPLLAALRPVTSHTHVGYPTAPRNARPTGARTAG